MLSERASESGVTLETFYNTCIAGRRADISDLLTRIPVARRLSDPLAIALRGMVAVTGGDVPGGIALIRRASKHSSGRTRQCIIDLLLPLLLNTNQFDELDATLSSIEDPVEELAPAFMAVRGQLEARKGNDKLSAQLCRQALDDGRALDNPLVVGRVLQRTALAAFFRQDFDEAQERALEAARWFERYDAHRHAANAYSILHTIANAWLCDPDVARYYARRMTMAATLAGDISTEHYGLISQLEIAAATGDSRRFGSVRGRLLANPLGAQYYTGRMSYVAAEALVQGWGGHFDLVRPQLLSLRQSDTLSLGDRALCDAMLGVTALASWQLDVARTMARRAISATTYDHEANPLFESNRRTTARIVAAAVCVGIGDVTRGLRALSRKVDPDGRFKSLITAEGMDEIATPSFMRGYARFYNQACLAAQAARPRHGLTPAEIDVLRALPDGITLDAIAKTMGKSRKTIERQVGSIYAKLEVGNRAQAVRRAHELGIYS